MSYISFPGLGIAPFHLDKVAFTILGRPVAWYGILITIGMVLCVFYATYVSVHREGLKSDDILDLAFYVIIFGVIGARLYYVAFEWNSYLVTSGDFLQNVWRTFKNVLAVWEGGLAIYGGVLGGLLAAYLFARARKIPFIKLFDMLAPTVLIGQIIGRWGNFVNMEAHGTETTLPWRMGLLYSASGEIPADGVWTSASYVHPTFLYESLWNLIGFILLHQLYKKKKFDGEMFAGYFIWYGFGRFWIEGLRTDSLMLGPLRVSQWLSAVFVIFGTVLMTCLIRKYRRAHAQSAYTAVYDKLQSLDDGAGKPETAASEKPVMESASASDALDTAEKTDLENSHRENNEAKNTKGE